MSPNIHVTVNGRVYSVRVRACDPLLKVLRNSLGLTGTKEGCDYGGCGACTVLVQGKAVYSCMIPAIRLEGKEITTIEGLARDGMLDYIQEAFARQGGFQCGFCTPGMIMSAKALLDTNPRPSEEDARGAIAGNLCRCTGYVKIVESIMAAARNIRSRVQVRLSPTEAFTTHRRVDAVSDHKTS